MLIVITGVIGAGKSCLVESLTKELKAIPFYEPLPESDNFMLGAYYKNPEKYSYSMQTLLLALRFQAHTEAQIRSARGEICIEDSSYYADRVFLEVQKQCGYIDDLEYRAYEKLCEIHYPFLQYPDLHIHLDLPLEQEIERIKIRSRECESGIPTDYLVKLRESYNKLIPHLANLYPLVRIDASGTREDVLHLALHAIWNRMEAMEKEAQWPTYKKNCAYPRL